ncbi:hypothetical protein [Zoogloea sp.]|uniref:hypothetical protein n=1 Tax=Zoogloea sp. TaxID=49181 RepID=UPI0035B19937
MSRKPVHLEMVGGKGPRQRVWEAIRRHLLTTSPFTTADLSRAAKVEMGIVTEYVKCLRAAGYIASEGAEARTGKSVRYSAIRDNGAEAPRLRRDGTPVTAGLRQEQMWRVLRMLKGTDINYRELAANASTTALPVDPTAANSYLQDLHGAKYLQRTAEGKGRGRGGIPARYRLVSDTGPKPPMVTRVNGIFDPNLGQLIWIEPINEETAIYG